MKNKINLHVGWIALIAVLFASCYKDKGNYDYTDLTDILITDAEHTERIYIAQHETLKLSPQIQLNGNEDNLSFLWVAYLNTSGAVFVQPYDTIGNTRALDYVIDGNIFTLGESYRLTYKVTNNATGISSYYFYNLTISNIFSTGWMFLEDKSSLGDLSMILNDNTVIHNIYSDRNANYLLPNPRGMSISKGNITDGLSDAGRRIYVWTENEGIELNALTMVKQFDYDYLFFSAPSVKKPEWIDWKGYISAWGTGHFATLGVIINNGLLHSNIVGSFPGTKKWGEVLRSPAGDYNYRMVPFSAEYTYYSAQAHALVMYDDLNRRFYSILYDRMNAFPTSASDPNIFDMNNVGLQMVAMYPSYVNDHQDAVMKDGNGTPYLLRFKNTVPTASPVMTISKQQINAPNAGNMSAVASSTTGGFIFYASGNVLYSYEYLADDYTIPYNFPSNEEVTCIRFDKDARGPSQPRLLVTTWNGSEGKVYYFNVSATNAITYDTVFTGFGKIIDMAYKS